MDTELIKSANAVGLFCRLYINMKRDLPIRPSEMGVLIFAYNQTTSITPRMISEFLKIAKPSVTTLVNSLIKQNYLIKNPSSTDGRSYTISVTESGKELVTTTLEVYCRSLERLKQEMGASEFTQMITLIQKANGILIEER